METLIKGKAGQIGEIRVWGGKKYQKTAKGWRPVAAQHSAPKAAEEPKPAPHAENPAPSPAKSAEGGENHEVIKVWGGKKYRKTDKGWRPLPKSQQGDIQKTAPSPAPKQESPKDKGGYTYRKKEKPIELPGYAGKYVTPYNDESDRSICERAIDVRRDDFGVYREKDVPQGDLEVEYLYKIGRHSTMFALARDTRRDPYKKGETQDSYVYQLIEINPVIKDDKLYYNAHRYYPKACDKMVSKNSAERILRRDNALPRGEEFYSLLGNHGADATIKEREEREKNAKPVSLYEPKENYFKVEKNVQKLLSPGESIVCMETLGKDKAHVVTKKDGKYYAKGYITPEGDVPDKRIRMLLERTEGKMKAQMTDANGSTNFKPNSYDTLKEALDSYNYKNWGRFSWEGKGKELESVISKEYLQDYFRNTDHESGKTASYYNVNYNRAALW